jgi:hypothetical protein
VFQKSILIKHLNNTIMATSYKGRLKGFPTEVVEKMLEYQLAQGNILATKAFERDKSCSLLAGGFDWRAAPEGTEFWREVIHNEDFNLFFEKYPRTDNTNSVGYGGDIAEFPIEVVEKMLEHQAGQGNPKDISVFERFSRMSADEGGFNWPNVDGYPNFWARVIRHKDFDLFFEKYPRTSTTQKDIVKQISELEQSKEDSQLPRWVLVSNDPNGKYERRLLFVIVPNVDSKYLCWTQQVGTNEEIERQGSANAWKYMKEIPHTVNIID